jgi:hypothetical protein
MCTLWPGGPWLRLHSSLSAHVRSIAEYVDQFDVLLEGCSTNDVSVSNTAI